MRLKRKILIPKFESEKLGQMFKEGDKNLRELEALLKMLQATDRILSSKDVSVFMASSSSTTPSRGDVNYSSAGGWTDGKDIWINEASVSEIRSKTDTIEGFVASVKGLNYHELAHIIFTPRIGGSLATSVLDWGREVHEPDKGWWCFNALEDQKAEMLFGKQYGIAYNYFKHLNLEFIVNLDKQDFNTLMSLEHGRLFLPKELRTKLFTLFANKHGLTSARELGDIIEEYMILDVSTFKGEKEALELVKRMLKVLPKPERKDEEGIDIPNVPSVPSPHFVFPSESNISVDDLTGEFHKGDIEKGDGPSFDKDDLKSLADDIGDDDVTETNVDESSFDESDPDNKNDPDGDSSSKFTNKSTIPNKLDGLSSEDGRFIDGIKEDADRVKSEDLQESGRFADDVSRTTLAMSGGKGHDLSFAELGGFIELVVTSQMSAHQPKLTNVLRKLRLDVEPLWHKRQESGSVNPERAMLADETHDLDVFDMWDEGSEEEGGIEVVLLIDLSSSMWMSRGDLQKASQNVNPDLNYSRIKIDVERGIKIPSPKIPIVAASQAVWMLKRTLDGLEIPVTVLGYNSKWCVLYHSGEKASNTEYRLFDASGGTNPSTALRQASMILNHSRHKNRVAVIVTDGDWGGTTSYIGEFVVTVNDLIMSMRVQGYTTMLLGIGNAVERFGDHGVEIAMDLDEVIDIADAIEELVRSIMLKANVNVHNT